MKKINWGVISTANIAVEKVIPAMQQCAHGTVVAIASRQLDQAKSVAQKLGIPDAHGSYQELLADPSIDAIYNPLPNHLHVPWSIKALEAGKHVLCEKPVGLDVPDAMKLRDAARSAPELKVMEAFMYRFHPQWIRVQELVNSDFVGELRTIQTFFSYYNDDPNNIRNVESMGGGGLMDIGCYPISQSRFLFGREPDRVFATLALDRKSNTDHAVSAILDFGGPTATFTCSTLMQPFQRAQIVGTEGRIEIEIPVNTVPGVPARLLLDSRGECTEELLPLCDQYTAQADALSLAILQNEPVPTSLDDAVNNMRIIAAAVDSHRSGGWVSPK